MHIIALNRRWVIYWRWLIVSLAAVAILLGLAVWQWQRAVSKAQYLRLFSQAQQVSAQQLRDLPLTTIDGLRLVAPAHWLSPFVWLLDNQLLQGQPGYDVIVPMQLDATRDVILVNLGWLAAPLSRDQLPRVNVPSQFNVQGVLRSDFGGLLLGENIEDHGRWPMRIQKINIAELSYRLNQSLYPGMVYQLQDSPYVVHYRPVVVSPERHRAYALQWSLLAVAVIIVAMAASLKKDSIP